MKLARLLIPFLLLITSSYSQNTSAVTYGVFGSDSVVINDKAIPFISPLLRNIGQTMHVIKVDFPNEVATVTNIQVRVEASYDGTEWFTFMNDVVQAPLNADGKVYAWAFAYGVFPAIRVRSVLDTGGPRMTVRYSGHILPVVPLIQYVGGVWVF